MQADVRDAADGTSLKELLTRKTGHPTFPNIVIGSRSIGGADDLTALVEQGHFEKMLKELGVSVSKA